MAVLIVDRNVFNRQALSRMLGTVSDQPIVACSDFTQARRILVLRPSHYSLILCALTEEDLRNGSAADALLDDLANQGGRMATIPFIAILQKSSHQHRLLELSHHNRIDCMAILPYNIHTLAQAVKAAHCARIEERGRILFLGSKTSETLEYLQQAVDENQTAWVQVQHTDGTREGENHPWLNQIGAVVMDPATITPEQLELLRTIKKSMVGCLTPVACLGGDVARAHNFRRDFDFFTAAPDNQKSARTLLATLALYTTAKEGLRTAMRQLAAAAHRKDRGAHKKLAERLLKNYRHSASGLYYLGLWHERYGSTHKAIDCYLRCTEREPFQPRGYLKAIQLLQQTNDPRTEALWATARLYCAKHPAFQRPNNREQSDHQALQLKAS